MDWVLFFNQIFGGDTGTDWVPSFVNLGTTGTPQFSGRYYKLSNSLALFRCQIVPATNTSSVLGNTYIENFPMQLLSDAPCFVTVPPASTLGSCFAASNRIFLPTWTNITVPITISGFVEAR